MNSRDYQILHLDTHKSTGTALRFNVMVESSIPPPHTKKNECQTSPRLTFVDKRSIWGSHSNSMNVINSTSYKEKRNELSNFCLGPLVFMLSKNLNYLAFKYIGFVLA